MTILKKASALLLAAGITLSLGACTPKLDTTISNTVVLDLDDSYSCKNGCRGINMASNINSVMTVTCEDIDVPEITVNFTFSGMSKKTLEDERDHLEVSNSLSEDGILNVSIIDTTTGFTARSARNIMKDDSPGMTFSHTSAVITLTVPKSFSSFDLSNYNGDLGAKDLSGEIKLFTRETLTGENISFNGSDENLIAGEKGVIISTARNAGGRTNVQVMSRNGAITYVMPSPSEMNDYGKKDTIVLLAFDAGSTVDLNGNECKGVKYMDKDHNNYSYLIGNSAYLENEAGDVSFTNGKVIRSEF